MYPCEYLRVSAPVNVGAIPAYGKQRVEIAQFEPHGQDVFPPERLRVTLNRHFSEPFTRIEQGDEIAIVPRSMPTRDGLEVSVGVTIVIDPPHAHGQNASSSI